MSAPTPSPETRRFTPGPWIVVEHCDNPEWPAVLPQRDGADAYLPLAKVHDSDGLTRDQSEAWANARLIAASPLLLEALDHPALRELLGAIEDSGTPEAARLWSLAMSWLDVRDAAIAAATGGV